MKAKVWLTILAMASLPLALVFAQDGVENNVSAVKAASPGDYILLPSGKKYILTKEEIAITRGEFDYEDLSNVPTTTYDDGTEVKTISQAHIAYLYPDGQATHIIKTNVSFNAFLLHYIKSKYYLVHFIDENQNMQEFQTIDPPDFDVFRAGVQFYTMSNGVEELKEVSITAFNYDGKRNLMMKYCSKPGMSWGNIDIDAEGAYTPTEEIRQLDFDVE
jgi:hypothetical protein